MPPSAHSQIGDSSNLSITLPAETLRIATDSPYDLNLRGLLQVVVLGCAPNPPPSTEIMDFCAQVRELVRAGDYRTLLDVLAARQAHQSTEESLIRGLACVLRMAAVDLEGLESPLQDLRAEQPDSTILTALQLAVLAKTQSRERWQKAHDEDTGRGVLTESALADSYIRLDAEPGHFLRVQAGLARSHELNLSYFGRENWRAETLTIVDAWTGTARPTGTPVTLRGATRRSAGSEIRECYGLQPDCDAELAQRMEKLSVLDLPDATVFGGEWIVRTDDPFALNDLYNGTPHHHMSIYGRLGQSGHSARLLTPTTVDTELPNALLLGGDRNYYHWMIDAIPRLLVFKAIARSDDGPLLTSAITHNFQRETLAACGVDLSRCRTCSYPEQVRVKKLTVPLLGPQNRALAPSYSALEAALHDTFAKRLVSGYETGPWRSAEEGLRIFVVRGKGTHRTVLNEAEIIVEFTKLGWTVVDGAQLTVREQIKMFNRAKVVVAPHGAALANTCFCRPGTQVIELAFPHWAHGYFRQIARIRALNHRQLFMRCTSPLTRPDSFADGLIDADLLRHVAQLAR